MGASMIFRWGRTSAEGEIDLRHVFPEDVDGAQERTAYLHVGAHKTGTTSLQHVIRENAEELYRQGIVPIARSFPWTSPRPLSANYQADFVHRLRRCTAGSSAARRRSRKLRSLRKLIRKIAAPAPHLLISEEAMLGRRVGAIDSLYPNARLYAQTLTRALRHHRPVMILYIRQQDRLIESNYLHSVKLGDARPFRRFVDDLNLDKMYWSPVVESLRRVCGAENVIVRPFESIRAGFVPFAEDFLDIFADTSRLQIRDVAANPSLSRAGVEVSRFLAPRLAPPVWKFVRQPVQRLLSNRHLPAAPLFDEKERESFRLRFEQDYQQALSLGAPKPPIRSQSE